MMTEDNNNNKKTDWNDWMKRFVIYENELQIERHCHWNLIYFFVISIDNGPIISYYKMISPLSNRLWEKIYFTNLIK